MAVTDARIDLKFVDADTCSNTPTRCSMRAGGVPRPHLAHRHRSRRQRVGRLGRQPRPRQLHRAGGRRGNEHRGAGKDRRRRAQVHRAAPRGVRATPRRRPRYRAHQPDRALPDDAARHRRCPRPRRRGRRSAALTTTGSPTFAAAPDRLFVRDHPAAGRRGGCRRRSARSKVPNLVGTFIRPNPVVEWRHFHDPVYDPMWQAASDAGWPIGLHPYLAADVPGAVEGLRLNEVQSEASILRYQPRMNIRNIFYTQAIGNPVDMMTSLAFLLAGGVCERFPDLRFIVLETNGGWITPWMERLDHNAKTFPWTCPTASCRRPSTSGASATSASTPTKRRWRSPPSRRTWGGPHHLGVRLPAPRRQVPGTVDELLENIGKLGAEAQQDIAWRNAAPLQAAVASVRSALREGHDESDRGEVQH